MLPATACSQLNSCMLAWPPRNPGNQSRASSPCPMNRHPVCLRMHTAGVALYVCACAHAESAAAGHRGAWRLQQQRPRGARLQRSADILTQAVCTHHSGCAHQQSEHLEPHDRRWHALAQGMRAAAQAQTLAASARLARCPSMSTRRSPTCASTSTLSTTSMASTVLRLHDGPLNHLTALQAMCC